MYEHREQTSEVEGFLGHDHEEAGEQVQRPIGLRFQFLEVCGGAGRVTAHLVGMNLVCGPVFDLSFSEQYNLADARIIQWIIFMLEEDRLDSFLVAPPCTSFSAAAHAGVRSYSQPRGFNQNL